MERDVLAARDVLDTMVVRLALVYGREYTIWSSFFKPILEAVKSIKKEVQIPLEAESRPGLVHVDDVASGLHCVEKLPIISGYRIYPIFDLVISTEPMTLIFETAAKVMGLNGGVELAAIEGDLFTEAMQTSINAGSSRAEQLLECRPKRIGFVAGMETFARATSAALLES
jgi:nucleoside-diphosphate-sugar epimerase